MKTNVIASEISRSEAVSVVATVLWGVTVIVLMMEAVSTSETSVNFYQTARRNSPEDSYVLNLIAVKLSSSRLAAVIACFCSPQATYRPPLFSSRLAEVKLESSGSQLNVFICLTGIHEP
jgi:hypothetical protein